MKIIYCCLIFSTLSFSVLSHNKYSKEANVNNVKTPNVSLKELEKPFRMNKLNILWTKAKIRLSEPKLKSLYGELKLHDKEEITWKRLKAEGKDKDGLKEAQLRKKLLDIMGLYGLLEHFEDNADPRKYKSPRDSKLDSHINKSLFKDKKLNKLWEKAESAGFTSIELETLREEFNHHQEKIDQYYSLLGDVKDGNDDHSENSIDDKLDRYNALETEESLKSSNDYLDKANMIREKHNEIKDGFDRLYRLSANGPNSKEFIEPKVQGLWKVALESNFTPDELESLRIELRHYEDRLLKLRNLQVEAAFLDKKDDLNMSGVKNDGAQIMVDTIKKQARKVEKLHYDLESKIMERHVEL